MGALLVRGLLLAGLVAGCVWPGPLDAQVPDTIPRERPRTPPPQRTDTVPDARPPLSPGEDTVPPEPEPIPPPVLPAIPHVGPAGWDVGVWEWNRADLLRLPDLSLLHLLERIPGITPVRAASVGQPEAASVFGATMGAITYEVDGFELDPLTAPTFDPSRFPLVALESVRIERRVTGARVRLRMVSPSEAEPLSVIEAGTGDLRRNLFRGSFLAPRVLGGALAIGFESLGAETPVGATSTFTGGWLKWTWAYDDGGVQLEFRQSGMERAGTGSGLSGERRDWALRARHQFGAVTAEAHAGASSVQDELGDLILREGTPQGGLRLHSLLPAPIPVAATAALRLRSHPRLPTQEVELSAWAEPTPWLGFGLEGAQGRWAEGPSTGRWAVRGRVGPVFGLAAFADLARDRGVALRANADPEAGDPAGWTRLDLSRDGARVGLQLHQRGLRLGGAVVRTSADAAPGFGLEFDPTGPDFGAGEATGIEVTARVPTGWAPLWLEGSYLGMDVPGPWLYLPADQWRGALVFHALPLPSGNLEIYFRGEHRFRSAMGVPSDGELTEVAATQSTNLELTIRVLTVRAFLVWDNILNRPFQQDVPGFNLPAQNVRYGVKWEFWN